MKKLALFVAAFAALTVVSGAPDAKAGSTAAQKCASSKIKAAEKKVACLLALRAKAALTGTPPDATKVTACGTKLTASYGKIELKGGCGTSGDAGTVENKVDAFVDDLATALTPVSCPSGCVAQGGSCNTGADCCSQACDLSVLSCECAPNGACCGPGPGGCCSGQPCVNGRCPCVTYGGGCSVNSDCCSGNCNTAVFVCQ